MAAVGMCHNPALVHDKPLGAPTFVKLFYEVSIMAADVLAPYIARSSATLVLNT